jgi:hypothetical protein
MKKFIFYITIILLIAIASNVSAIELTKWKYYCEITIDGDAKKYARVDITPEIYDAAKLDLSDIRIIDSQGQQVPYLLTKPNDVTEKYRYAPDVINRSTNARNDSLVTLDFGKQTMKNSIEVETGGNNFRRAVKIEGSNDNITFFTIVEQAFVFAIDNPGQSRFNNVDLPANDYRYLRITVEPMAGEQESPVIKETQVFKYENKPTKRIPVEMLYVNHTEDGKNNLSIYEYDLQFRNLPISQLQLSIADESFYRHVTVEGRNAATRKVKINSEDNRERFQEVQESWKSISSGTIYRYASAEGRKYENMTLSIPSGKITCKYLKITISNYDDRPLKLEAASAKMITNYVVFDAGNSSGVWLYVGCESAARPEYDITHKLNQPSQVKAASARLSPVTENPLFGKVQQKPVPWTEQHKVLLLIIMAVVALALGGFILKSFKSIQRNQTSNPE